MIKMMKKVKFKLGQMTQKMRAQIRHEKRMDSIYWNRVIAGKGHMGKEGEASACEDHKGQYGQGTGRFHKSQEKGGEEQRISEVEIQEDGTEMEIVGQWEETKEKMQG